MRLARYILLGSWIFPPIRCLTLSTVTIHPHDTFLSQLGPHTKNHLVEEASRNVLCTSQFIINDYLDVLLCTFHVHELINVILVVISVHARLQDTKLLIPGSQTLGSSSNSPLSIIGSYPMVPRFHQPDQPA
jgi:hypothetical protein